MSAKGVPEPDSAASKVDSEKMIMPELKLKISLSTASKRDKVVQGLQYNERLDMNISKVNISKFYNDLSDDSDSDMENKLDKLKDLFSAKKKIGKYLTVCSPRSTTKQSAENRSERTPE